MLLKDGAAAGKTLNDLYCQKPKHSPPTPPPTPPPPPPPLGKWSEASGANCYGTRDGGRSYHGATDLEHPVSAACGVMTLVACQEECLKLRGCDGVTVLPTARADTETGRSSSGGDGGPGVGGQLYNCYRKGNVDLAKCDHGTTLTTYVHETL